MERSPVAVRWLALAALSLAPLACAGGKVARGELDERLTPGIFLDPEEKGPLPPGVEPRSVSPPGLALTKRSEGFVGRLYEDAARYCTIAYGHLVKKAPCDGSEPGEFQAGVTEPRGAELLAGDMGKAERAVVEAVEAELSDGEFGALCDFVYNVGARNFRGSTLLRVVNDGEIEAVPRELRRWVRAGGKELPGLKLRREREIELFFSQRPRPKGEPGEGGGPVDIRAGE